MNLSQVVNSQPVFAELVNKKMPVRLVYKITKLIEYIDKESAFYHQEFSKIMEEYALKDDNGNYVLTEKKDAVKIKEGKETEVQQQLKDLNEMEVETPPVTLLLSDLEELDFTPLDFALLIPFIKED